MAKADTDTAEDQAEGSEGAAAPKKKMPGKKLVLLGLPVLLLLGGGGAFMSGALDGLLGGGAPAEHAAEAEPKPEEPRHVLYYDMPEMLVNLNSAGRKTNFLKITVALELEDKQDVERLDKVMPRIVDNFQVYLRELRSSDLRGSTGIARLREELLRRVRLSVEPLKVNDLLFREMLVQ